MAKCYINIKTGILLISYTFCFGFQNLEIKADSVAVYLEKNNSFKAINYLREKSILCLKNKKYKDYCDVALQKSDLYEKFNDKENALKILFEAMQIADRENLVESQAYLYRKIGSLNASMFEYTKARKYLNKSRKISLNLKNKDLHIQLNQSLFYLHSVTESDSAKYFLNQILHFSKDSKDLNLLFSNHENFFHYYNSKNQNIIAKKHLDSAYAIAVRINNKNSIANSKSNLGYYYMTVENDYEKGKKEFLEILKMYPNKENPKIIGSTYLNISYAYEKLGDYKKALEYSNKYYEIYEEVSSGRFIKSNQEIETKYQIDKVESQFNEKQIEIEKKQTRNQILLIIFASLFILAGFIFYFYYQNLLLKQKNKIKDIDNKLQYKIISATLDGQDQERNKISGVLHDHVSAILSSVGLHLSAFEGSLNTEQIAELKKTRLLLKEAHDKVRDLSHELVSPLLVKLGLQFALKDLCENNSNSLIVFDFNTKLEKHIRFDQEFEIKIYYIVSELLNNVIKHSNASECYVGIEKMNNQLHIIIKDNGKGFVVADANKTNGFGITQIRARVKNMQGDIEIKSALEQGTTIDIKVNF